MKECTHASCYASCPTQTINVTLLHLKLRPFVLNTGCTRASSYNASFRRLHGREASSRDHATANYVIMLQTTAQWVTANEQSVN
jgi:hypothetical protein